MARMKTDTATLPKFRTVADLLCHLGRIPADRIRWEPTPGTATERDLLQASRGSTCELVDGVLVEKPMGYLESRLALVLSYFIMRYLEHNELGFLGGESGLVRVALDQVRAPDLSFYFWTRFPRRRLPKQAILSLTPDWAIEVLSRSNTKAEMRRKRQEYFRGGASLVWEIDPRRRTITSYTSPRDKVIYSEEDTITAEEILPGFSLSVRQLFERTERPAR